MSVSIFTQALYFQMLNLSILFSYHYIYLTALVTNYFTNWVEIISQLINIFDNQKKSVTSDAPPVTVLGASCHLSNITKIQ